LQRWRWRFCNDYWKLLKHSSHIGRFIGVLFLKHIKIPAIFQYGLPLNKQPKLSCSAIKMVAWSLISLALANPYSLFAQQELTPEDYEETILEVNDIPLRQDTTDAAKINTARFIQQTLLEALQHPESWDYSFDRLKYSTIPIAAHPKAAIRIFTFNVILNDGVFHQYGVIQHKKRKRIKNLRPLRHVPKTTRTLHRSGAQHRPMDRLYLLSITTLQVWQTTNLYAFWVRWT
jgi:hypothetical protein